MLKSDDPAPRHAARATRSSGQRTRTAILDAATAAIEEFGIGGVSLADIAARADCFPSQVTYYFGSKDVLLVEAACRAALHTAEEVEAAARRARSARGYLEAMLTAVLASPGLLLLAEAMLLAGRRPDLRPLLSRTVTRLHGEGARAAAEIRGARKWQLTLSPEEEARTFWSLALGLAVERAAVGPAFGSGSARAAVLLMLEPHQAPCESSPPARPPVDS